MCFRVMVNEATIHCKNEIGIWESRVGSKVDSNIKFGFMIGWFGFVRWW